MPSYELNGFLHKLRASKIEQKDLLHYIQTFAMGMMLTVNAAAKGQRLADRVRKERVNHVLSQADTTRILEHFEVLDAILDSFGGGPSKLCETAAKYFDGDTWG